MNSPVYNRTFFFFHASLLIRILRRMLFEQHTKQHTKQSVCVSFTESCVANLSYAHVMKISFDTGGRSPIEIFRYATLLEVFSLHRFPTHGIEH